MRASHRAAGRLEYENQPWGIARRKYGCAALQLVLVSESDDAAG
jgi:hypothetical protein